jgi:hypothetical protein
VHVQSQEEPRVAVAGDWHGNTPWMQAVIQKLALEAADVRTILHAGDFGIWPGRRGARYLELVDEACAAAGIQRILLTPGNHDDWEQLDSHFTASPGRPARLSESVWALPRGHRFQIGARTFLSFGGAASVDFEFRQPGVDWWLSEVPTDDDVSQASAEGPVDVLITHETIDGGTPAVQHMLRSNAHGWSAEALAYSSSSRSRVTQLWAAIQPPVLLHGHMHIPDQVTLDDGRRVYSLGADGDPRNFGYLRLDDLSWTWGSPTAQTSRPARTLDAEHTYLLAPGDQ